jgi:DNA-binding transcriptional MerR regulator
VGIVVDVTATVTLSEDQAGYLLDGDLVEGFGDRADLPDPLRYRIARWASALAPDQLEPAQRELIESVARRERPPAARRARQRSEMLRSAVVRSLWETLEPDQQRAVLEVDSVLGEGQRYPLTSGQLARLTGIEQNTIRRWRLPHTRDERGHREYGAAAVVLAFAFKGTKQNSREYFKDITTSPQPLIELRRSIALAAHSAFASQTPPQLDEAVAHDLELLARESAVLAEAFARAAAVAREAADAQVDTMNLRDVGERVALLEPLA